jgi:hypothetical protein
MVYVIKHGIAGSMVQEFEPHRHIVIPRRCHRDRMPLDTDPPLLRGLHPRFPVELPHASFGV